MNLPPLSSLPNLSNLGSKVPDNMKTVSVTRRHGLLISHAVPANRVLAALSGLPSALALDTLKVEGESCAILQTSLVFNDNFHYSPLPIPSLDFWQLDFRVLVRRNDTAAREAGVFVVESYAGTRVAWAIQRAVASEAAYADFNVIVRGSAGNEYSALIADIIPNDSESPNGTPPTQIAVSASDDRPIAAPFANWTKMTEFLASRPVNYSRLSVGEKTGVLQAEAKSFNPIAATLMPVGSSGEIKEARLGVWEKLGLLNAREMRRAYSLLIQPETAVTLSSPAVL